MTAMYKVAVIKEFSSAHNLREHGGDCENLHGHNWKVEVRLKGDTLDGLGMLVDFRALKKELSRVVDRLDHKYLNELAPFDKLNPTSENLARYIYEELNKTFRGMVDKVRVWESKDSCAEYTVLD